jgi:hypothetical protein
MTDVLEQVIAFMEADGWPCERQNPVTIRSAFEGKHGRWEVFVSVRSQHNLLAVFSIAPAAVPAEERTTVGEFLHRANFGLYVGNFDLDYTNGRVQARTGLDFTGTAVTDAMIKNLLYLNVTLMDRYLPGLQQVIDGSMTPEAAANQIEG